MKQYSVASVQTCPAFARRFHDALRARAGDALPALPGWPAGPSATQVPLFPE
ncbi:hypothetical protein HFP89_10700 [Wenzhouxiangella sp. XN79A]|uniref:hypothetical protein n=1 Tax=Wenzhouxiangella sp. XN79A TaxID=2724193 RepID=UPI00144A69D2|nr:hypothetical protein [Wenzhouxiangella sp. XN79A]NKI35633.1 hypothetical protein [Wenzhouxiangella sp. XN79A]